MGLSACIEHKQNGSNGGYGNTTFNGRKIPLHRKVYCVANGVPPESISGLVVRHKCDNPRCINPDHLIVGTHQDNMNDMADRGRSNRIGWHSVDHSQIEYCRGENKPNAVWTNDKVRECRALWASGDYKQTELAARYGCRQTDISRIVNRHAWKHI